MNRYARPLPGPGVVARTGDLMLVCADGGSSVDDLLAVLTEVSGSGGDGAVLVRRIAALLANDFEGRFPACAVCGPASDGRLAVLVYGTAVADITGAEGPLELSAADAITPVTRMVSGPVATIRLRLPGAGEPEPRSRLDAGVVAAAGLRYAEDGHHSTVDRSPGRADWPTPPPIAPGTPPPVPPVAPPAEEYVAVAFPVTMPPPDLPPPPSWTPPAPAAPGASFPEPDAAPLSEPDAAAPGAVSAEPAGENAAPAGEFVAVLLAAAPDGDTTVRADPLPGEDVRSRVLGIYCPKGHFTDPAQSHCLVCGASLAELTAVAQEGPRPPLGMMLFDDGSAYSLDADYVLGREPQHDPDVVAGLARPLKVVDAEGVVSRRHLRIALVGWDIEVIDLGSANGTFLQPPGSPERVQLAANTPAVVRLGTLVTMGRRWFRFESPRTA